MWNSCHSLYSMHLLLRREEKLKGNWQWLSTPMCSDGWPCCVTHWLTFRGIRLWSWISRPDCFWLLSLRYSWDWRSTKVQNQPLIQMCTVLGVLPILLFLQPETLASLGGNKREPGSGLSVLESAFEVYNPVLSSSREGTKRHGDPDLLYPA